MSAHTDRVRALGASLGRVRITLCVVALASLLAAWPGASAALEYEAGAFRHGALWRGLTGHLVHYSASHFTWNAVCFVVLGALCECADRRRFLNAVAGSAVAIPVALYLLQPELPAYRGLSGVASALFGFLAGQQVRTQLENGQRGYAALTALLCLAFTVQLGAHWLAGETLLITGFGSTVAPVPLAHAVGLGIGAAHASGRRSPCPSYVSA